MSLVYDQYLNTHITCVKYGFQWIISKIGLDTLNEILPDISLDKINDQMNHHDQSKLMPEEYDAYDRYFYSDKTDEVKKNFDYAWLHHIHMNPHHWQYWLLKEDDTEVADSGSMPVKALEIPDPYILEMLCDWWAFSWAEYIKAHDKQSLYEVFDWYDSHFQCMVLNQKSARKVSDLLILLRSHLDQQTDDINICPPFKGLMS